MLVHKAAITAHNETHYAQHAKALAALKDHIADPERVIKLVLEFQVAIPSWALGTGGSRFGRFPGGGEPRSLEEKIEDVALLHRLNQGSGLAISLHIPWDIPSNPKAIRELASSHGLRRCSELQYFPGSARSSTFL